VFSTEHLEEEEILATVRMEMRLTGGGFGANEPNRSSRPCAPWSTQGGLERDVFLAKRSQSDVPPEYQPTAPANGTDSASEPNEANLHGRRKILQ
jgi:hypothetical protein